MSFSKSGGFVRSFGAVSFVVIPAVLALLAALFIAACAKGKAGIGEAKTDAVSSVAAAAVMLDDALAEIRDFAPGEGVPAGVFDELRAELMRILEDSAGGPEGGRTIAKAPSGDSGLVTDFAYDLESRTL